MLIIIIFKGIYLNVRNSAQHLKGLLIHLYYFEFLIIYKNDQSLWDISSATWLLLMQFSSFMLYLMIYNHIHIEYSVNSWDRKVWKCISPVSFWTAVSRCTELQVIDLAIPLYFAWPTCAPVWHSSQQVLTRSHPDPFGYDVMQIPPLTSHR